MESVRHTIIWNDFSPELHATYKENLHMLIRQDFSKAIVNTLHTTQHVVAYPESDGHQGTQVVKYVHRKYFH
jgi:hypothetical protein